MALAASGATWGIPGPEFLVIYLTAAAAAAGATFYLRSVLARGSYEYVDPSPDAARIGYLAGGPRRAALASLAGLLRAGAVGVGADTRFRVTGPLPDGSTPLDAAVLLAAGNGRRDLTDDPSVRHALDDIRADLIRLGLLASSGKRRAYRLAALSLVPVIGLGTARILADPDLVLIVLVVASLAWMALSLRRTLTETEAGRLPVRRARWSSQYLAPDQSPSYATYGVDAAAMGVALYGFTALWQVAPALSSASAHVPASRHTEESNASSPGIGCGGCGGGGCGGCGG